MTSSSLERAIDLMREAQRLLDSEHPVIAAHLETAVGLAVEQTGRAAEQRFAS